MGRKICIAMFTVVTLWAALDLWAPQHSDIRHFNPHEVARIETTLWRSYYDRKPLALYGEMAELLRTQYRSPWLRSYVTAYHAARAAFVFKRGVRRVDYELALPELGAYYRALRKMSDTPFDVDEAARLELDWWIIHRERNRYARDALASALAALQATVYNQPSLRAPQAEMLSRILENRRSVSRVFVEQLQVGIGLQHGASQREKARENQR